MTRQNEYELGELAEYNGVKIVATPNTLSGKPRLDGHRIGINHIVPIAEMDGDEMENVLEAYPHLEPEQVEAALQFAEEHNDIMSELNQREEMLSEVLDKTTRTIQCTCSETFHGLTCWQSHIETVEPEYRDLTREDRAHFIEDDWYETETIVCTCGETYSNPWNFIAHSSYWYEIGDHLLEAIRGGDNE